jgi:hypothetical protein
VGSARRRKVSDRSWTLIELVDGWFFALATALVLWLAWLLFTRELGLTWRSLLGVVTLWLLLAYVGLPRLQELLARMYVPDYFIGRTLTSTGILGDPVNLALDGTEPQVHAAMVRAGWTRADEVTLRSAWGIIVSAVFRRSYAAAPVSPLFLFGRRQAFAYEQQVGGDAAQRHHVRFWPVPAGWILPGGHRVGWLGAGTYDRAVGLSLFTFQVTHKVDADVDIERDHVVSTVREHNADATVRVIENFSSAFHSRNGGGDVVRTDGNLVVVDLSRLDAPGTPAPTAPSSPRLPPPALTAAGLFSIGKAALALTALGPASLASVGVVALWLLTLARHGWARVVLMAGLTVEAAARLAVVQRSDTTSPWSLLDAGASVLILIAVSSVEARRWTSRAPS